MEPIFITYCAIIIMASVCVWIGCQLSLTQSPNESMTQKDAYMFPVYGSGVLFGLYLLFKMFSKAYINLLLTAYFLFFGLTTLTATLGPVVQFYTRGPRKNHFHWVVPYVGTLDFHWGLSDVIAAIVSLLVCIAYAFTKHWVLANVLGVAFSVQGIALLSLGSYRIGCVLLGGLFFYDIFWVFGTDVMVTVAKSFDAPIKLVFPRDIFATGAYEFSMLGLGDIVIPGVFVALLLRFDRSQAQQRHRHGEAAGATPMFNWCYASYVAGLMTTIFVMHTFKAAQPALLYLVPYCG
jgi:minor histocompatibility antigen H13